MCSKQAVNREHAPPKCFFPATHRDNLISVPSCEAHNNENTLDVEYVRNMITTGYNTNALARQHFKDKVLPSFEKSPRLREKTLKNAKPIIIDGQETGFAHIDLVRYKSVISAIAYALYFRSYQKSFKGVWVIVSPSLTITDKESHSTLQRYFNVLDELNSATFFKLPMPHPEIFNCGVRKSGEDKVIFKFIFYEGFVVYATSLLKLF